MNVGDRVNVFDVSWSFGIYNGQYRHRIPLGNIRKNLVVVKTGLSIMKNPYGKTTGEYREQNDLLVTDKHGNFWFIQSRFCELVNKEIEVRYYCDGKDVTDSISDETKKDLRS